MNDIICLNEVRLKRALKEAQAALIRSRTMVIEGKKIPDDLIPRLEAVIVNLEKQLIELIEKSYNFDWIRNILKIIDYKTN